MLRQGLILSSSHCNEYRPTPQKWAMFLTASLLMRELEVCPKQSLMKQYVSGGLAGSRLRLQMNKWRATSSVDSDTWWKNFFTSRDATCEFALKLWQVYLDFTCKSGVVFWELASWKISTDPGGRRAAFLECCHRAHISGVSHDFFPELLRQVNHPRRVVWSQCFIKFSL